MLSAAVVLADDLAKPAQPIARAGKVAIIGRPNVGKSTLLNAALAQPLAIVSPVAQTTREPLLGIVRHGGAEICLLDTPGLHKPRHQLGRRMNRSAREVLRSADVVVFVVEIPKTHGKRDSTPFRPHPGDTTLLADIAEDVPVLLVINKIDLIRDKSKILPLLDAYSKVRHFEAMVPISARRENGIERVLDEVARLCPEGKPKFGDDDLTDRSVRFLVKEYVREPILLATKEEVPHAVAITVERFVEPAETNKPIEIDATIHVEREGQKGILIGKGGQGLKSIGIAARRRIQELLDRNVRLNLWVRVTENWRELPRTLDEFGYGGQS